MITDNKSENDFLAIQQKTNEIKTMKLKHPIVVPLSRDINGVEKNTLQLLTQNYARN